MGEVIGWTITETIGTPMISPWFYVKDAIQKNKTTCNETNVDELIELCLSYFKVPDVYTHTRVYDWIETVFPHLRQHIDKYRVIQ